MKLRIKGNSVRIRLTKSEVHQLVTTGRVEQATNFINSSLNCVLETSQDTDVLSAVYANNTITLFVQSSLIENWANNSIVGFEGQVQLTDGNHLALLLEKDFVCKDITSEDQRDYYDNPNELC